MNTDETIIRLLSGGAIGALLGIMLNVVPDSLRAAILHGASVLFIITIILMILRANAWDITLSALALILVAIGLGMIRSFEELIAALFAITVELFASIIIFLDRSLIAWIISGALVNLFLGMLGALHDVREKRFR